MSMPCASPPSASKITSASAMSARSSASGPRNWRSWPATASTMRRAPIAMKNVTAGLIID
ncbi:hypothetical protein ACFV24_26155 [Nocardia fluminea]|uniref:hypothetical protein n=1 Tax=Nocardia fluminea TaxID=134984 RepID=UPI00366AFA63